MRTSSTVYTLAGCCFVIMFSARTAGAEKFSWEWRQPEELAGTLRTTKVTKAERLAIAKAVRDQRGPYSPDMAMPGIEPEQQFDDSILDTRVNLADLNGDGKYEVIAQGTRFQGCSPTGNCPFWIFQKSGQRYKVLVSVESIQSFQIQHSRSQGYSDIVLEMHGSATQKTLRMLRYRDGTYHESGCFDANWTMLEGDTVRELADPRVTPCEENR